MNKTIALAGLCGWVFASAEAADSHPHLFLSRDNRLGAQFSGENSPAGVRFFIAEPDRPGGWTEWGFDWMSEGTFVYRHRGKAHDWSWDSVGSLAWVSRSNEMAVLFPALEPRGEIRWAVEWYDPQTWRVLRRFPPQGVSTALVDALPHAPRWVEPPIPPFSQFLAHRRPTLSQTLERDVINRSWIPSETVPPLPSLALGKTMPAGRLVLRWTDPGTADSAHLEPREFASDGSRGRWRGKTPSGDEWTLVAERRGASEVDITAWVSSGQDRCFRLSIGVEYPRGAWTWFDDVHHEQPMAPGESYTFAAPSPYGLDQSRSYYPLGVIANERVVLVAETDGREPRHHRIEADHEAHVLWIHYDLAATPATRHFPGLAAVRARFRAEPRTEIQPFRAALQAWYARDLDWHRARVSVHGLWMPFTDIGTVSNAADFHFAFFEKVGPLGDDLDNARAAGALNFIYTEPWLYWMPLAHTSDWNRASALQRMQSLATAGIGRDRDLASAALLGATRDPSGQIRMQFLAVPWNSGARMEVVTDPELPAASNAPINRAEAEWRFVQTAFEDARVDGVYLDSMSMMDEIDYNPAALAVADHPATFTLADLKPGLAMPIQAVEYTAALASYLRSTGKYVMANFPCWRFPFFMPYIDVPGEETSWYHGSRYEPMSNRELNYRRAMAGAKPYGFLQGAHFDRLSRESVERYFLDCLAFAFLPSFFSHDGASAPYWADARLYERDRPLFREYLPLIVRLSQAGWQPVPAYGCAARELQIEQFGSVESNLFWITVRNTGRVPVAAELLPRRKVGHRIAYSMRFARAQIRPGQPLAVDLDPGDVDVIALATASAVEQLQTWAASLEQHHPQYRAAASNLRWISAALASPESALSAMSAVDRFEIETPRGVWIGERHSSPAGAMERFFFEPRRSPWIILTPEKRIAATAATVEVNFQVYNRASEPKGIALHIAGDVPSHRKEWTLPPRSWTQLVWTVTQQLSEPWKHLSAKWVSEGQTIQEDDIYVVFAKPVEHLARQPGVRVTADSVFAGYTTKPLHDGIYEPVGLPWDQSAFASGETPEPRWIRVTFPEPTTVSTITAYWHEEGGVRYASRQGEAWGLLPDGRRIRLGAFSEMTSSRATVLSFAPQTVTAIEWRQPAGGGHPLRPNLIWIAELEIR